MLTFEVTEMLFAPLYCDSEICHSRKERPDCPTFFLANDTYSNKRDGPNLDEILVYFKTLEKIQLLLCKKT